MKRILSNCHSGERSDSRIYRFWSLPPRQDRQNDSSGFTLVEILIVMAIMAFIGVIIVMIFANSLRGANKAQILSAIKQNGQSALDNMEKTIKEADSLTCISNTDPDNVCAGKADTIVVEKNGIYTRYRILSGREFQAPPAGCANNRCIIWDSPYDVTTVCDATDDNGLGIGRDPMNSQPDKPVYILTDNNPQTGVSVADGSFSCSKPSGYKTNVSIKFSLGPGAQAPAAVAGQIDPVIFQTTVELR